MLTAARSRAILTVAFLFTASAVFMGCPVTAKKKRRSADLSDTERFDESGLLDIRGVDVEEADIRDKAFANVADLQPIYFKYDNFRLTQEARLTLRNNSAYLKANPKVTVLVEGHCDDRGTTEYNIALGQKRARKVREYYMRLGVNGQRMGTLSYGEEAGLCYDQKKACWETNRRALTKIDTGAAALRSLSADDDAQTPAPREGRKGFRR